MKRLVIIIILYIFSDDIIGQRSLIVPKLKKDGITSFYQDSLKFMITTSNNRVTTWQVYNNKGVRLETEFSKETIPDKKLPVQKSTALIVVKNCHACIWIVYADGTRKRICFNIPCDKMPPPSNH